MAKKKKSLQFTFFLPVAVELDIEWDDEHEEYSIDGVERLMIQPELNDRDIFELLPQSKLDQLDDEIRKEFTDA